MGCYFKWFKSYTIDEKGVIIFHGGGSEELAPENANITPLDQMSFDITGRHILAYIDNNYPIKANVLNCWLVDPSDMSGYCQRILNRRDKYGSYTQNYWMPKVQRIKELSDQGFYVAYVMQLSEKTE